ncbi:MAG: phosphoribosylformylglycinamidine synthase subunit PurL [candidate division KSB1 bacterium]|nr:phosphoribosylformylglycinamidine synthase subunit PurL [candidate division KSB1 bacterium]
MVTKIEIGTQPQYDNPARDAITKDIQDLGIRGVTQVKVFQIFYFHGNLSEHEIERICQQLLIDHVSQVFAVNHPLEPEGDHVWSVEITYNPGVMDPVAESTLKGISDLGIVGVSQVKTASKYHIYGSLSDAEKKLIIEKRLANKLIQHVVQPDEKIFAEPKRYQFSRIEVPLLLADDDELLAISRNGQLFLNLEEMKAIQAYYRKLGRQPSDVELETLAQTWSEHCVHKTFRGIIDYDGQRIDNLLKTTIMKVTRELNKPWCVSVFTDNAGVIEFDEHYDVCFKVETHNHPSALEPYGGANTGIGGVIRDPLGTGLGAKPIANTDVFCFAPPDYPMDQLPPGTLHPKRIFLGVHAGVRDYGNRMGIPTINGAIYFDERYVGNPLVFCGNVGLLPKGMTEKQVMPGDRIVVVGGRTGRDGIHGATFSSGELTTESELVSSGAVQIGNPITEKKLVDTLLQARDRRLYRAITDCGAGGLSSAVGELCAALGAEVDLDLVPLKYEGLSYTEIWISEAQERMVLIVPPQNVDTILELFASENVEATVIGTVTRSGRLVLRYQGNEVGDLEMEFLHHGLPRLTRRAIWKAPSFSEPEFPEPDNLTDILKQLLSSWNICSKEWVIRQYDHEVQGGSVLKPLVGEQNDGPSDAAIIRPVLTSNKGIILANGCNPKYGLIDPYFMAASAIDEAIRQIIAVGGKLDRIALLDNFCWGNTDKPDRLAGLVRAAQACYDIAQSYETPFISGKDSLNNEYQIGSESIAIPPTLLISAIGIMDDVTRAISMDVKRAGDLIYILGDTKDELGGSHYYDILGLKSSNVPQVDPRNGKKLMTALSAAMEAGLVRACHDCSEGGLAVAAAEMAFAGGLGMVLDLRRVPSSHGLQRNDKLLFSESNSRFVVEVPPESQQRFEQIMADNLFGLIGQAVAKPRFRVVGLNGNTIIEANIYELKEAWQRPLRW